MKHLCAIILMCLMSHVDGVQIASGPLFSLCGSSYNQTLVPERINYTVSVPNGWMCTPNYIKVSDTHSLVFQAQSRFKTRAFHYESDRSYNLIDPSTASLLVSIRLAANSYTTTSTPRMTCLQNIKISKTRGEFLMPIGALPIHRVRIMPVPDHGDMILGGFTIPPQQFLYVRDHWVNMTHGDELYGASFYTYFGGLDRLAQVYMC